MIELATKTITAESRIGNHNAVMETIVPPVELDLPEQQWLMRAKANAARVRSQPELLL